MKTDKPIKITPAKLDRIADECFRKAKRYESASGLEPKKWAEDVNLAGLALRRWAEQLCAEKKGGRK